MQALSSVRRCTQRLLFGLVFAPVFTVVALCGLSAGQACAGIKTVTVTNQTDRIVYNMRLKTFKEEQEALLSSNTGLYLQSGQSHTEGMQDEDRLVRMIFLGGLKYYIFDNADTLPQGEAIQVQLHADDEKAWLVDAAGKRCDGRIVPLLPEDDSSAMTLEALLQIGTVQAAKGADPSIVGYADELAAPCRVGDSLWAAVLLPQSDITATLDASYSEEAEIDTVILYAPRGEGSVTDMANALKAMAQTAPDKLQWFGGDTRLDVTYEDITETGDGAWQAVAQAFMGLDDKTPATSLMVEALLNNPGGDRPLKLTLYGDSTEGIMQVYVTR